MAPTPEGSGGAELKFNLHPEQGMMGNIDNKQMRNRLKTGRDKKSGSVEPTGEQLQQIEKQPDLQRPMTTNSRGSTTEDKSKVVNVDISTSNDTTHTKETNRSTN